MGFENSITGQNGVLIRQQIQSPNFATGVSGWIIAKDGSAQFNNLTVRGTFFGTDYIVNSSGIFFYSGTPAANNLVGSFASVGGTDGFGNVYPAGMNWQNGGLKIQSTVETFLGNLIPILKLYTGGASENTPFHVASALEGSGASTVYEAEVVGPTNTNQPDVFLLALRSSSNTPANLLAQARLSYNSNIAGGNSYDAFIADYTGIGINAATIAAKAPGTGGGTGNVPSNESWHGPNLNTGWASGPASGAVEAIAYELSPIGGHAEISGSVHTTSAAPTATMFTLPSAYWPVVEQRVPAVLNNGGVISSIILRIDTAGNVIPFPTPTVNGVDIYVSTFYRLV